MVDLRQLEIVSNSSNGSAWPNSLAVQFFTSLRHHAPELAQVRSLDELTSILADAAEEAAQKPLEREFVACAARTLAVQFTANTIRNIICECASICESPIELATVFALGVIGFEEFDTVLFDVPSGVVGNADSDTVLRIKPQAQTDQYRVDILLTAVGYQDNGNGVSAVQKQVVVECDGSDSHDTTVEQLVRDRRRDRQLQKLGLGVFRYSGAEIWRDVFDVARKITSFLKSSLQQQKKKPVDREESGGSLARTANTRS